MKTDTPTFNFAYRIFTHPPIDKAVVGRLDKEQTGFAGRLGSK